MSADLLTRLREAGLLEYGSHIPASLVQSALGLLYPTTGSRAVFERLALAELGAIDYVRRHLLNEGKYITSAKDGYRILLPSENEGQVEAYMRSADEKLRRGLKLLRNTPKGAADFPAQTEVRLHMKQTSVRRHRTG